MEKNSAVIRLDYPDLPSVQLPWYPRSCGKAALFRNHCSSYTGIDAVELIWATAGKFIIEYDNSPYRLELKAGQSTLRLFNEKRVFRNIGHDTARYRWVCFDGAEAEKFIMSYGIRPRTALNSGECPEDLFTEAESLLLLNTPYAMRKLVSVITNIIALMIPHTISPKVDRIFNLALTLISRDYRYPQFNISALADALNIHRTTLDRTFQANLQKSPHEYLTNYRLSRACSLLTSSNLSVEEVARSVGFARCNYFCRIFSRQYNLTPGNWRKQQTIH